MRQIYIFHVEEGLQFPFTGLETCLEKDNFPFVDLFVDPLIRKIFVTFGNFYEVIIHRK